MTPLKKIFTRIFSVHPGLTGLENIRRAQLLMAFSLVMGITTFLGAISSIFILGIVNFNAVMLFCLGLLCSSIYALGRTRYYQLGSWLLVSIVALFGYLIFEGGATPMAALNLFIFIPMAMALASALLGLWQQLIFLVLNIAALVILPQYSQPGFTHSHYAGIIGSLGTLMMVISVFRQRLENERLRELQQANTELRSMQQNLETMVSTRTKAAEEAQASAASMVHVLEEQIWISNGQVTLADALREDQSLAGLAENALRALCVHLSVPVAAFFLMEKERLNYLGGYSYVPAENASFSFRVGEGLIGQVALDRQRVVIRQVKAEYLQVVSGLGDTIPEQVVILPCIYNRRLVGVLELGVMSEFSLVHLNFLEQSVENIAAALLSAQTRQQVNELLTETQAQAEELQAREEELRSVNEVLRAQAENLRGASLL